MKTLATVTVVLTGLLVGCASPHHRASGPLQATGQATFEALEEVVTALRQDPETDWARVDIDGLRDHLLDMDYVTMQAKVDSVNTDDGVLHTVSGAGPVVSAIQRMSAAHANMVMSDQDWAIEVSETDSGAVIDISANSESDIQQIRAIGFFGFLSLGGHHQRHHWSMASGQDPHHH